MNSLKENLRAAKLGGLDGIWSVRGGKVMVKGNDDKQIKEVKKNEALLRQHAELS